MKKDKALNAARLEVLKSKVDIVVVRDPIANAEDASGPYGYAPRAAVDLLFPHREKEHDYFIEPDHDNRLFEYTAKDLAEWTKAAVKKGGAK